MVDPHGGSGRRYAALRLACLWLLGLNGIIADSKPNFVILFADNLGYADVGAFSGQANPSSRTLNIDRLANQGLKLEHWNSAAHLCSASRAALLTGKYPVRSGIYPGVFKPDASHGLSPTETTIAEYLKKAGYATSIVGKWHLGHRSDFLPTNQGFDEWLGVPYHMSGGSLDNHTCAFDSNDDMWLPLYHNDQIIQQPLQIQHLAASYADKASEFIHKSASTQQPFFLYLPFSHVHQLCAPRDQPEQSTCQWSQKGIGPSTLFSDAVEEMDWIVGRVLLALEQTGVANDTFVLFTSDNGPWVAEQSCAGEKGPFRGQWLIDNVPLNCYACPHDYVSSPTPDNPRRCILQGGSSSPPSPTTELTGVHCGEDSGLGSMWEANLRMPAIVRWPGKVQPGRSSSALVSTLDVLPTVLATVNMTAKETLDGMNILPVLLGQEENDYDSDDRTLFLWRDGFRDGPLPPPFGRIDVVGVKMGCYKVMFSTKSAHYNDDPDVWHDPPLVFDVLSDPAEANALNPNEHGELIELAKRRVREHKATIHIGPPLALARDAKYIPCADKLANCRTGVGPVSPE